MKQVLSSVFLLLVIVLICAKVFTGEDGLYRHVKEQGEQRAQSIMQIDP